MRSSSTSNSEAGGASPWRRFLRTFVWWVAGLFAVVYGFVLFVDPYDTLPFSPKFEREPISTNARFSFPALAAKTRFDSAIVGTSTSRLLRPDNLDRLFGTNFVNLAMNSATAYEQQRIFELFVHHHPQPKLVIVGLDIIWCEEGRDPPLLTFRPFPPWLYDTNAWNDALFLFNKTAVEQAGRQAARALGIRKPKYGLDGHTDFLPQPDEYDLAKVRRGLYRGAEPHRRPPVALQEDKVASAVASMKFPTHRRLDAMMAALPAETLKILYFVPYHHFLQAAPGSLQDHQWTTCKRRIASLSARYENVQVVDFMIASAITLEDSNYWDALHYTTGIAGLLEEKILQAVRSGESDAGYYNILRAE